jgi:DNA-binding YbaB/EbfC family protein
MEINPLELLKNAGAIKEQFGMMQAQVRKITATGSAGGGIVKVTLNGQMEMVSIELDPLAVDNRDVPMLQDLIVAAHDEAQRKITETLGDDIGSMLGGGMDLLSMLGRDEDE